MSQSMAVFYRTRAEWWLLLSPVADYAEEAAVYLELLQSHGPIGAVLELGCGGGNVASYLKAHFELTLIDLAPEMLAQSEALNPECTHGVGDMRTVRLGRTFDGVFVHDAVMYMASADDLRAAMRTAFEHLRPGGVAVFCPDYVADGFVPYTDCGGEDGADGRSLRYLEWVTDPDPDDETCRSVYSFVLQHPDGRVESWLEDDTVGLFSETRWLSLLAEVGFEATIHRNADPESPPGEGPPGQVQFVGRRPESGR